MVLPLLAFLLYTFSDNKADSCDLDVIVIGAGVSGLGAAQELLYQGCRVIVLEARDRTGGRIYSKSQGDYVVDVGASWIHGIGPGAGDLERWDGKKNPIYAIAKKYGVETVPTWQDDDEAELSFYWYKSPSTSFDENKVYNLIEKIEAYLEENRISASVSDSIADVLKDFNYGSTTEDELIYKFTLNLLYGQEYADETSELSAQYFDDVYNFNGAEHVFPGGYKQIIDILSENVNILFNQVVQTINYSGDQVTVKTSDGESYTADKVIVTVPLGVLQAGSIAFVPELSEEKTDAINRLGMGVMDKLWLEFEEAFWTDDEDTDWICFISDSPGSWVEALNADKYLGAPLLIMFNIGDAAKKYSTFSDDELLAEAMITIRKWYPDAPDYVRYTRSNWSKDPYARGSYSYMKAGATPDDCESYREFDSTDQKVFFAGEGTYCSMMGAVHAAYISGVDAANYAIDGHDYNEDSFEDRYEEEDESGHYLGLFLFSFILIII
jgi:monoamine oxidase